ncbi:MAG: L-seryl-tRNA(Sec) selenium transferase [Deltaproteobacteria bacterium]|nr:L-seryl-tRNA(Sec) selenium transferase [Deltaproteobacteria bacterium]
MRSDKQSLFRKLPGVDQLLGDPAVEKLLPSHPKALVLKAINQILDGLREGIREGDIVEPGPELNPDSVVRKVVERVAIISLPSLRNVINATGVVVHTNLGRSILSQRVLDKFRPIGGGYSNLEYDLQTGRRGSRYVHVEDILRELTSAEAAMVVNNNAAAVLIALETLARDREVVVSRGQLVEIGGSFRIPDVMRKSGARMVEVGTTNKTHLKDYEEVIGPRTALLLKVHTSNFQVVGFTEEVPLSELSELGRQHGVPVMEDLGSGSLVDFSMLGLMREPTVQDALGQGADLVTFSGDKLLGGPQAGIILGRRDLVEAIRKNQLNRALRIDKLTLVALEETLRLYRDQRVALKEIPTLEMISKTYDSLAAKAERLYRMVSNLVTDKFSIELRDGFSRVGGGALPLQELKSRLLCLVPGTLSSHQLEARLRANTPPVITRLEKDRVVFDVRTVQEGELEMTARAIRDLGCAGPLEGRG